MWRRAQGGKTINKSGQEIGGEAGIRTLGRALRPYNGLANRRLQPLGHLTASLSIRDKDTYTETLDSEAVKAIRVQTVAFDASKGGRSGRPTGDET